MIVGSRLNSLWKTPSLSDLSDSPDGVRVEELLNHAANSSEDFLKLWPSDKQYFWSSGVQGFVAYKVVGPIAFAIADPIAASADQAGRVLAEFLEFCHGKGWRACFLLVGEASRAMYKQAGLKLIKIGGSAVVDVRQFNSQTAADKWWRWERNRGLKLGYTYACHTPPHSPDVLADLSSVSAAWLTDDRHSEFGFMLGYYDEGYLQRCTVHILRNQAGQAIAFANELPIFNRLSRATPDLMRFIPAVPNAVPYLLLNMLQNLQKTGRFTHFDLGFVPLARMHGLLPSVARVLGLRHFSASGLEQFKNKFDPAWEANYLACHGDLADLGLIALHLQKAVEID